MAPALVLLVAVLAQAQPPSAPRDRAASSSADTASIAGRVTDKETGRPLHRAIVYANLMPDRRSFEALTDAEGKYEITALPAGDYTLSASAGERRASHLPQAFGREPSSLTAGGDRGTPFALKAGEALTGADFALTRALAIEGRVLDPLGEPMADVRVHVVRPNQAPVGQPVPSDDRGEFRAFGLPPGRYRVCVSNPDASRFGARPKGGDSRLVATCHPASTTEANASDVVLTSGDVQGIDIRVQRAATFSVSGSIVDASGAPADGAFVSAIARDDRDAPGGSARARAGQFEIGDLPEGRYVVRATIGGEPHPFATRKPEREAELGYAYVDVGADVAGVTLATSKGVNVPGRIVTDDGAPLPSGAKLQVLLGGARGEPWIVDRRSPFVGVDAAQRFELTSVFRVPQVVVVMGLPDGWAVRSVVFSGQDITDVPVDLASRPDPAGLVITLTSRVARPSFRIVDDHGKPSPSGRVVMFPADRARWGASSYGSESGPSSSAIVTLDARVPGDYLVAALGWDDYTTLVREPQRIDALAAIADRVTLAEGRHAPIDVRIRPLPARTR